MAMSILRRYPWKLCLIKYEWNINFFVPLNCLFIIVVSCFLKRNWETQGNRNFSRQKKSGIFHIFDQIISRVKLYIWHCHLCLEGSLENTRTVHLKNEEYKKDETFRKRELKCYRCYSLQTKSHILTKNSFR